jgi:hypothetical protein
MNLSLPLKPDQVKRRYRELAMQWHPDHNDEKLQAHAQMTALNSAAELLTGVDLGTVPRSNETTIVRDPEPPWLDVGGLKVRLSFNFGDLFASDWIYAASFAAHSNSVYLASYSGRVVVVDENGEGRGSMTSAVCHRDRRYRRIRLYPHRHAALRFAR